MIATVTTWADLELAPGNVLLIINSRDGEDAEVAAVLDCLTARGAAVHVIAPISWHEFLSVRGIEAERLLFAVDPGRQHLELNFFLESARSLEWIRSRQFRIVTGSAPHGLYNEEVKRIFEERVCLFLRAGVFAAHTLPHQYVYLFDLASMFTRLGRDEKLGRYQSVLRGLIDDCYRSWMLGGRPAPSDCAPGPEVRDVLSRHLGSALLDFDEQSPIPLPRTDVGGAGAASIVMELGDMVRARDQAMNGRRVAVLVRDAVIDRIPLPGLRRWLRRLVAT
jgi:hypothetical protein